MSMWKGYAGVVLFLVAACAADGQELALRKVQSNVPDTDRDFTSNRWTEVGKANREESFPGTATSKSAGPGGLNSARFQLSEGADFFRFRSPPFTANTVGIKTSGSYAVSNQFGVECAVATAFGREIYDREHVKLLFVDCGPRVVLETGKIEPWAHALGGWVMSSRKLRGTAAPRYRWWRVEEWITGWDKALHSARKRITCARLFSGTARTTSK
jgi:hypothetical protein